MWLGYTVARLFYGPCVYRSSSWSQPSYFVIMKEELGACSETLTLAITQLLPGGKQAAACQDLTCNRQAAGLLASGTLTLLVSF